MYTIGCDQQCTHEKAITLVKLPEARPEARPRTRPRSPTKLVKLPKPHPEARPRKPGQLGQTGQYGQYPEQFVPEEQPGKKRTRALMGVAGAVAAAVVAAALVLGFLWPGWFVTTKLDVNKAQAGVQQVLTDETTGYGAKNVKDVKCNHGQDPIVKKGGSFDCDVNIDGASKHVTVTFQDGKGTYEVGRPQ